MVITDLQELMDDDTSTSNELVDIPDIKRQLKEELYQQVVHGNLTQQQVKGIQNSYYGTSPVMKASQDAFRRKVDATFDRHPTYCQEFDGRDYRSTKGGFTDALQWVEANRYGTDEYTWLVHPETMFHIKGFYEQSYLLDAPISSSSFVLLGVPFRELKSVPEGWVLLAQKKKFQGSGAFNPARAHPMSLIRNVDAGFHERIELHVGGSIDFRVMNP